MIFRSNWQRKCTVVFSLLLLCFFTVQAQNNNSSGGLGTGKSESSVSGSSKKSKRRTTTAKPKKSQKVASTKTNTVTERNQGNASNSSFTSEDVIGTWRARVTEFGETLQYDVTFYENGSTEYLITMANGKTFRITGGSWNYSKETLYEKLPDGSNGKGSIQWLDRNNVILTIVDNGDPKYAGLKRRYRRIY